MLRGATAHGPPNSLRRALFVGSLAGLLPLLAAGNAGAKQGMVATKDHHTFVGDVSETATPGHVDVNSGDRGKVSIDARNVDRITYFSSPKEELDARWAALDRKDVAGRVALAKFAYDNKMYDAAHDVLASALAIEPANRQALDLQQNVDEQIKLAHPPPPPTTAVANAPATAPAARPGAARAIRRLTPEEVNLVRQFEWQLSDTQVPVALTGDTKRTAIDLGIAGAQMTPAQIGWEVLHKGPPGLRKGVKLGNDPAVLQSYKQQVQRFVVSGCAAGQCHNTDKGGKLYLFTAPADDVTALTDYVILQEFTQTVGGVEYSMIDRNHPAESLLVQYSLPLTAATVPHPKAAGYTAPARTNTIQIRQIQDWIAKLAPVASDYEFNLSTEPKKEDPKAAGGVKASAPTTRPRPTGF